VVESDKAPDVDVDWDNCIVFGALNGGTNSEELDMAENRERAVEVGENDGSVRLTVDMRERNCDEDEKNVR
jgi:hypothetical protein